MYISSVWSWPWTEKRLHFSPWYHLIFPIRNDRLREPRNIIIDLKVVVVPFVCPHYCQRYHQQIDFHSGSTKKFSWSHLSSELRSSIRSPWNLSNIFFWLGHHLLSDDATQMIQIGVSQGLIKRLLDPSANKGLLSSYCQFLPVLFPLFLFGGRSGDWLKFHCWLFNYIYIYIHIPTIFP